jgi:hypothetical protein
MTLPDERTRALLYAQEFLRKLLDPKKTPKVPSAIRDEAYRVLRHYPGKYCIDMIAKGDIELLAPVYKEGEEDNELL